MNCIQHFVVFDKKEISFYSPMVWICKSLETAMLITIINLKFKSCITMVEHIEDIMSKGLLPDEKLKNFTKMTNKMLAMLLFIGVFGIIQVTCFKIYGLWSQQSLQIMVMPWTYNDLDQHVADMLVITFALFRHFQLVGIFSLAGSSICSATLVGFRYADINSDIKAYIRKRNLCTACTGRQCIETMETYRKRHEEVCKLVKIVDNYMSVAIGVAFPITVAIACFTLYSLSVVDHIGDMINGILQLIVTVCHLCVLFGCGVYLNSQVSATLFLC